MRRVVGYTGLLFRSFLRDVSALFFSLFLPLGFMLLFGALNFGGTTNVELGVVDQARNADSERFLAALEQVSALDVRRGDLAEERRRLERGERDMVLVLPADFRIAPTRPGGPVPTLDLLEHSGREAQVAVGSAILSQVIDRLSFAVSGTAPVLAVNAQRVSAVQLRYVDFLVPGIVGMNVMQLAIFGVAFSLVADKQRGVLRRIMATPMPRTSFLAAHVLMRLVMTVAQVAILLAVALLLFKVQVVGSIIELFAVVVLGSILFLTIGFAFAGWATTVDQVPPVTQLVTLPQLFLSGVFFSRDAAPAFLRPLADVLPLTFLNDALREIGTQGATLADVWTDVAGLLVWSVVGFVLAVRLFRLQTD